MTQKLNLEKTNKYYQEALDLIPGAILGIRRPYNFVPGEYPIFFESGKAGTVTDVDGNEYIDMLCAYGPIIIGHREEEIDNAAIAQIKNKGFCMSLTQEVQNRLAVKMRELIPSCEKSVFVKTGSDATSTAVRIARAYTGKEKIFRCGYHGWHDWCVEGKGGVLPKSYEDVHEFHYNDMVEVEKLFEQHKNKVAAIIITPVGHPLADEVQMPKPGYLEGLKKLAHENNAIIIFDEIRTGFRVSLGGAQQEFGVTPDMSVFGKAMANGYPISAVVGKAEIMDMVKEKIFISSTFFPNSIEQVAALKTIEMLQRDKLLDRVKKLGTKFEKDVLEVLAHSEVDCSFSGGPWMPFITFNKDEKKLYKARRNEFYTHLIRNGVFLQPYHHGYIAARHTEEQMKYVVKKIEEALSSSAKIK